MSSENEQKLKISMPSEAYRRMQILYVHVNCTPKADFL